MTSTAPLLLVTELEMVCVRDIVNAKHHLKGAFTVIELLIMRLISEC